MKLVDGNGYVAPKYLPGPDPWLATSGKTTEESPWSGGKSKSSCLVSKPALNSNYPTPGWFPPKTHENSVETIARNGNLDVSSCETGSTGGNDPAVSDPILKSKWSPPVPPPPVVNAGNNTTNYPGLGPKSPLRVVDRSTRVNKNTSNVEPSAKWEKGGYTRPK